MVENNIGDFEPINPGSHADFRKRVAPLASAIWPEFMLHDPITDQYWGALYEHFADLQFGLLDTQSGQAIALGNSVPLRWEGELVGLPEGGLDWALERSVEDRQAGREPNMQCAIQVAIRPDYQGRGLSTRMIEAMRSIGKAKGLGSLIAPVRPNQKSSYPLASIDRYVGWVTPDGLPFDAWLRVHARVGAKFVKVCHQSMVIRGTVEEWQSWTRLTFRETGPYVVPGALNPVDIDVQADQGVYMEPNVWMLHTLD